MPPAENEPENLPRRLAAAWSPSAWQDLTVLVAVSGGADSVALLRGLASLKSAGLGQLAVAHFNHRLRGAESMGDEEFVLQLSRQLGLTCHVGHAGPGQLQSGGDGLEAAARQARYAFLQSTAERLGARYVVTAHTADDQAETMLHRLVRGTGLAGLAGMRRARALGPAVTLLRPLLDFRRADIEAYLAALDQPYRHDSSNGSQEPTRNRVRYQLLPLLAEQFNPAVVEALLRLGRLAGDAQQTIQSQAEVLLDEALVARDEQSVTIDCGKLAGATRHLVRELMLMAWQRQGWPLQGMSFDHWEQLAGLALQTRTKVSGTFSEMVPDTFSAKRVFPGGVIAERLAARIILRREPTTARPNVE